MRLAAGTDGCTNFDVFFEGVKMTPHPHFLIEVADEEKRELECVVCVTEDGQKRIKFDDHGRPVRCVLRGPVQIRPKG